MITAATRFRTQVFILGSDNFNIESICPSVTVSVEMVKLPLISVGGETNLCSFMILHFRANGAKQTVCRNILKLIETEISVSGGGNA